MFLEQKCWVREIFQPCSGFFHPGFVLCSLLIKRLIIEGGNPPCAFPAFGMLEKVIQAQKKKDLLQGGDFNSNLNSHSKPACPEQDPPLALSNSFVLKTFSSPSIPISLPSPSPSEGEHPVFHCWGSCNWRGLIFQGSEFLQHPGAFLAPPMTPVHPLTDGDALSSCFHFSPLPIIHGCSGKCFKAAAAP